MVPEEPTETRNGAVVSVVVVVASGTISFFNLFSVLYIYICYNNPHLISYYLNFWKLLDLERFEL